VVGTVGVPFRFVQQRRVLAPRAAWRSLVVQFGTAVSPDQNVRPDDAQEQVLGVVDA